MVDPAARVRIERDLYRGLLALGAADDPRPLLEAALRRVVNATEATQGYIALYGGDGSRAEPVFALAHHCTEDDVAELRTRLSRGIVRDAIESGQTISTAAAIEDPRFMNLESVSLRGIRAVLCAPVGDVGVGVLYLQGRSAPGPFPEADRALVEAVARQVAPYAQRLLRVRRAATDPTAELRSRLSGLEELAGRSPGLAEVFGQVALVAPIDVTVLIRGPSGCGKTALARAIHQNGPRRSGPFVELNCAAIPEALIESELFGAERGAHSTADRRIDGKVVAASGGTLLLDEIGELSAAAQAKLLTFLQSKTFYRLGSSVPETGDVRVLAASHVDLEAAVRQRRFREDLYYRLSVLPIVMPPLRERGDDVEPIAERVLVRVARRHGLSPLPIAPSAMDALLVSDWPGQVRQLANVVEAGLIRATAAGATRVEHAHLFPERREDGPSQDSFHGATRVFQRRLVERALAGESWNVSAVARRLDLSRSRLNELIRSFGLVRP